MYNPAGNEKGVIPIVIAGIIYLGVAFAMAAWMYLELLTIEYMHKSGW